LTDGHRSYPESVAAINGDRHVVIHEHGFKNKEEGTTNLIEDVWSHLKFEMVITKGVKKSAIRYFLEKF
jgi:hypothetical protein